MDDFRIDSAGQSDSDAGFPHIGRSELVVFGMPRILGTRLTVYNIVTDLTYQSVETVSTERNLEPAILAEALAYCASQSCGSDPQNAFCTECSKDGSPEDELPDEPCFNGWEMAADLIATLKDLPKKPAP